MTLPNVRGRNLPESRARFTTTSCSLPRNATEEEWEAAFKVGARAEDGGRWWQADLLNAAPHRPWGEKYKWAAKVTGKSVPTLKHYAWIARSVHSSIRIDELSWGHHELVAPFDPKRQRALLREARKRTLTRVQFRQLVRGSEPPTATESEGDRVERLERERRLDAGLDVQCPKCGRIQLAEAARAAAKAAHEARLAKFSEEAISRIARTAAETQS